MTITIGSDGLQNIYDAQQSVTIVRNVDSFVMTTATRAMKAVLYSVAWLAFQPYGTNTLAWTDACNLFASTTKAAVNNVIVANSSTSAAQAGQLWTFQNGQFSLTASPGGAAYLTNNLASNSLSFGLLAAASVNGAPVNAPLNLQAALAYQTAQFTPSQTITIFLSSAAANGTVIPSAAGAGLTVTVKPDETLQVGFNARTNQFYVT